MREDWVECTLEELTLSLKRGPFGGDLKKIYFVDSGFAVYEQQHAINDDFSNIRYFIDESRFKKLQACKVEPGDYIVSCSGTMGRIARVPIKSPLGVINQALLRIKLNDKIMLHNYFIHFFKSSIFQTKILKDSRGSGMQNMAGIKELKPISIGVPPLNEQKVIVKKIEELFSSLDSGIADLKKAQAQLKIYRQAVLKKAFEGKLTKKWREKNSINRKDWKKYNLGKILKTIDGDRGKNYPKKHEFLKEGYCLFLSTKNVRQGEFTFEENLFITEEKDNLLRGGKLERNDVILTTRGTLGNVALYDSKINFNNIRINSGMLILRVNDPKELSQHFLMRFINSSLFLQQLKAKQSGTAQPQIPANVLREIKIDIPSTIQEQNRIVQEIESRLSVCDKVEESVKESLEKAQALRQSILKKAFEGNLLSEEEIAQCKAHKDYEPASVLLERIRKEKKMN